MELLTDSLEVILTRGRMSDSKFNSKGAKTFCARQSLKLFRCYLDDYQGAWIDYLNCTVLKFSKF